MGRLVLALVTVSLLGGTRASALVLCQTRGHALFARPACRRKETPVMLSAIGVAGPRGVPGPVGSRGAAAARLVDADGRDVGPVMEVETYAFLGSSFPATYVLLASPPIGMPLILGIDVTGNPTGSVLYQTTDCSGTPFVSAGDLLAVGQAVESTVFYPAQPTSVTAFQSAETTDRSNGCTSITARGGCCRAGATGGSGMATAATTTLDALGITPPLHGIAGGP
ncbi:MAG TPA: hypothetical protein VKW76_05670 [Candidatus Binatia bacterium]|nr:hypothetical protein [Candidatus Binatia bacterium]